MTDPKEIFLANDAATAALGEALMPLLAPGDLVLLRGELGAGKTALARAIIRNWLNEPDAEVPSPSFAMVQPYERNGQTLLHADLYRITTAAETDELGLIDSADAIVLVEWPQNAPELEIHATMFISLALAVGAEDGRLGRNASIAFVDPRRQEAFLTRNAGN